MTSLDHAKVAAARLWASARQPYLSSALFACSVSAGSVPDVVTIDRAWRIHADPGLVERLDVPELGRLLLHLSTHLVRGHADRADAVGVRDADRPSWNRCADAEINDDLHAAGLLPPLAADRPVDLGLPDGGLVEGYFAAGADAPPGRTGCGSGAGGLPVGDDDGPPGLPPGQAELLRLAIAADIAERHRREPGSVPAGWARWAESLVAPRVDWRRVLGAEIRRAVAAVSGAVDYTYRRPSRRTPVHVVPRPVLPRLHRPVPSVAVVCDTSGSMGSAELEQVLAEIDGLLRRAGLAAARLPVLSVDAEVQAVGRVTTAAQVRLSGGGGTDMGAGIVAALGLRPRPDVIIVLTDGWTPWPSSGPAGCRVVVGVFGDGAALADVPAWARAVHIELGTG